MLRVAALLLVAGGMVNTPLRGVEQAATPPLVYELQINGENFLVEANQQTKVESKKKPGVHYNVAVRVAPTQRVRLNTVQLEYDLPAKIEDDGQRENRSVRLTHELGFSVLLCDLGRTLDAKNQENALKILSDSVVGTLKKSKWSGIAASEPYEREFSRSHCRGITIRCRDTQGRAHVYLAYVLTGKKHSATCVIEYLDSDGDEVLPILKKVLDSVRSIEGVADRANAQSRRTAKSGDWSIFRQENIFFQEKHGRKRGPVPFAPGLCSSPDAQSRPLTSKTVAGSFIGL